MEDMIKELVKTAPGYACILAIVFIGMKWHERIATHWVDSFKEVGEKCHDSHEKVGEMFHEQSCKGQEVLTHVTRVLGENAVQMERCARADEERNRILQRSSGS